MGGIVLLLGCLLTLALDTTAGAFEAGSSWRPRLAVLATDGAGVMRLAGPPAPMAAVTVQATSRRRRAAEPERSSERLTLFGRFTCPDGFAPLFTGHVFAFVQKGVETPQFGGVDQACWIDPPLETDFLGNWTSVGDCVVCEPDGAPPGGTTTAPAPGAGGGGSSGRSSRPGTYSNL
jgi:hypothetical protein